MSDSRLDILVLGAGGPIGQALARVRENAQFRLHLTSRRRSVNAVDVLDIASLDAVLRSVRPHVVVDLSNTFSVVQNVDEAVSAFSGAVDTAARAGVGRFIFASSAAVYGDAGGRPFAESDPLRGKSAYALWKIRSERVLCDASETFGISALSLRIFNVYGPGCNGSLVNRLAAGPAPTLAMTRSFVRDYVHVDEVASAILAAAQSNSVGPALNVSAGTAVNNLELAAAVRSGAYLEGEPLVSYSVGDPRQARDQLSWSAHRLALQDLVRGAVNL